MTHGLTVLDAGLLTTIQDLGRPGHAHLGVPRSGALDQSALRLANRIVGNPPDCAAIETTLLGCALRASGTQVVATTGAFASVEVDGRPMPWGARVVVPDGAVVRVGRAELGARSMIAVAGGLQGEVVLGSRSTDTLGGLGPAPLAEGAFLDVGPRTGVVEADPLELPFRPPRSRLALLPGPHVDWCDPAGLAERIWSVGPDSNRIGLRLTGSVVPRLEGEVRTFPMVLGAVQLPPSGEPIILLADHATTGGYPVVAVVAPDSLDACAQWRPGDHVTTYWR